MSLPKLYSVKNQSRRASQEYGLNRGNWQETTVLIWIWTGMPLWNKVDKGNDKENWVQAMKRITTAHLAIIKVGCTIVTIMYQEPCSVLVLSIGSGYSGLCFDGNNKTKIFPRV